MIYNLVRKDILIVRKYIYFMITFSLVAPPFLLWNMQPPESMVNFYASMIFFLVLFVTVLFLSNSVSLVDEKYQKGCAYLCTTPYSRKQIVVSKYLFSYLVFIGYCLIYKLSNMIIPKYTADLSIELIAISFFVISLFRCILIPLEFKFGYEKAKYIITFLIIGTPFLVSMLSEKFSFIKLDTSYLMEIKNIIIIAVFVAVLLINILSVLISCHIFERKDL